VNEEDNYTVHTIIWCRKCGLLYDMDLEEAPEDDHISEAGDSCYSEDWHVESVSHPSDELCLWDD
jgi:hypothetical protein